MFNRDLLKLKMAERKMSQYELARAVFASQPMIAGILLGYKQPSLGLAARIAGVFGCSVDDFVRKE